MARNSEPPVLVVIGVHREELAFGEKVAEGLSPDRFRILRIPRGVSGERPRGDEMASFQEKHWALYLQILEHVKPGHRLMIDLHQGIDSNGSAADVLCADQALLEHVSDNSPATSPDVAPEVRCVRLVHSTEYDRVKPGIADSTLVARPVIPEAVWNHDQVLYVGIEVYLKADGTGTPGELALSRSLIERVADFVPVSPP